jgi:DNA-binding transcriptional regulator LsrR (DeoR family)
MSPRKTNQFSARQFIDENGEQKLIEIANLFMEKLETAEIEKWLEELVRKDKGKSEEVYEQLFPAIIRRKWLRLATPEDRITARLIEQLPYAFEKDTVRVAPLADPDDVAAHAAYMISKLVWQIAAEKEKKKDDPEKDVIRIGFSGGNITRKVFQKLVQFVSEPSNSLSSNKTVVCHALVAGFDNTAPGTEPSAFFSYLDDCKTTFAKKFVQFHAPAFVPDHQLSKVREYPAIQEARDKAEKLDLIVTSAASFNDDHSQFRKYYEDHKDRKQGTNTREDLQTLIEFGCVGDMLWLPLGKDGPLKLKGFEHRPVALIDLEELPGRIQKKTRVLLVIGPCAAQRKDLGEKRPPIPADVFQHKEKCKKTGILEAILKLQRNTSGAQYITHLVVDRETAVELLKQVAPEKVKEVRELELMPQDDPSSDKSPKKHKIPHELISAIRLAQKLGAQRVIEVANLFMEKLRFPVEIAAWLKDPRDLKNSKVISAKDIYTKLFPAIIYFGWLKLKTPDRNKLALALQSMGYDLDEEDGVRVAPLADPDDVATHAAYMIIKLVQQEQRRHPEVRIGFSGGNITRRVFQKLVQFLTEPSYNLSGKIVCHALVAGFDNEAPGTEPSSFFSYLDDRTTTFEKQFVQFHAPAFVPARELETMQEYPAIKEASGKAKHLHLIVTSAASFADEHSQLRKYYYTHRNAKPPENTQKDDWQKLVEAECIGDMLWLPLNKKKPLGLEDFDHRPVALLDLNDLPERIADGTKVLLVIGPCPVVAKEATVPLDSATVTAPTNAAHDPPFSCNKTGILKAILSLQRGKPDNKHVTHLVVDKETAIGLIEQVDPAKLQNLRLRSLEQAAPEESTQPQALQAAQQP